MRKSGTIVPWTIKEWESAILAEEIALGIPPRHRLSSRVLRNYLKTRRRGVQVPTSRDFGSPSTEGWGMCPQEQKPFEGGWEGQRLSAG